MKLDIQKRLAAEILGCSKKRIKLDLERLADIKEAITKADIRNLIKENAIKKIPKKGVSRGRARKRAIQKKKGRQKGEGSRKGGKNARLPKKEAWINRVRAQRLFLKALKDKGVIDSKLYRELYLKSKGGFFRSKRHIKIYLEGKELLENEKS